MTDVDKVIQHFQDAIEESGKNDMWCFARLDIVKDTIALLKEQPKIVRCQNCKWWKNGLCENDYVARKIYDCGCYPDFRTDPDWFCADGERKVLQE